mmetsp:Transcript_30936/g.58769  ORF Transcript_30936/g.58769 Transcript_30936/m.58769 type:complete len:227 (+) Transcript_30936:490-1170(+)
MPYRKPMSTNVRKVIVRIPIHHPAVVLTRAHLLVRGKFRKEDEHRRSPREEVADGGTAARGGNEHRRSRSELHLIRHGHVRQLHPSNVQFVLLPELAPQYCGVLFERNVASGIGTRIVRYDDPVRRARQIPLLDVDVATGIAIFARQQPPDHPIAKSIKRISPPDVVSPQEILLEIAVQLPAVIGQHSHPRDSVGGADVPRFTFRRRRRRPRNRIQGGRVLRAGLA